MHNQCVGDLFSQMMLQMKSFTTEGRIDHVWLKYKLGRQQERLDCLCLLLEVNCDEAPDKRINMVCES